MLNESVHVHCVISFMLPFYIYHQLFSLCYENSFPHWFSLRNLISLISQCRSPVSLACVAVVALCCIVGVLSVFSLLLLITVYYLAASRFVLLCKAMIKAPLFYMSVVFFLSFPTRLLLLFPHHPRQWILGNGASSLTSAVPLTRAALLATHSLLLLALLLLLVCLSCVMLRGNIVVQITVIVMTTRM